MVNIGGSAVSFEPFGGGGALHSLAANRCVKVGMDSAGNWVFGDNREFTQGSDI
jgi:hypothetical protein